MPKETEKNHKVEEDYDFLEVVNIKNRPILPDYKIHVQIVFFDVKVHRRFTVFC